MHRAWHFTNALFGFSFFFCGALLISGCTESLQGASNSSASTTQQPITTSHQFSTAPDISGPGNWEVADVVIGQDEGTYLSGEFFPGNDNGISELDFGCSQPLENPSSSLTDVFLVKFDENGICQWQKSWGSDETNSDQDQLDYSANDLELTPQNNVVLAAEKLLQPQQPTNYKVSTAGWLREIDQTGTQEWMHQFTHVLSTSQITSNTLKAVDIVDNMLVATGEYTNSFSFARNNLNNPRQLMVLTWNPLSSGSRVENWGVSFGGQNGSGQVTDIDAHNDTERITVVGNYTDSGAGHTHLNGVSANAATNTSFFLQSMDFNGSQTDAYSSPGSPADPDDFESVSQVEFAPDGELYIAGQFYGHLNPSGHLAPNYPGSPSLETNGGNENTDYFIVRFTSADQLGSDDSWVNFSDFYDSNTASNSNSPNFIHEEIRDMQAFADAIAITGSVSDPRDTGTPQFYGFAHVHDFSVYYNKPGPLDPVDYIQESGTSNTEYDIAYYNSFGSGVNFFGSAVAATTERLVVGGANADTNYSLGGSTLPGGYGFLVSYDY